jgi:hypothetical protein
MFQGIARYYCQVFYSRSTVPESRNGKKGALVDPGCECYPDARILILENARCIMFYWLLCPDAVA